MIERKKKEQKILRAVEDMANSSKYFETLLESDEAFRVLAIIFVDEINNHKMKACDMERTAWSAWNIRLGSLEGLCSEYSQSVRSETLLLDNLQPKVKEGYILLTNWCQIMNNDWIARKQ
jgi:hypothetical protein